MIRNINANSVVEKNTKFSNLSKVPLKKERVAIKARSREASLLAFCRQVASKNENCKNASSCNLSQIIDDVKFW